MEIIKPAWTEHIDDYQLCFKNRDVPGAGWSFPCDKDGSVDITKLHPYGLENYELCLANPEERIPEGVQDYSRDYRHKSIGKCVCGREVELGHFTCPCDCGRDYNWGGQRLAPRSQWGEDTGESLSDILSIP